MIELTPKKSLGQHFLQDPKALERIASAVAIGEQDLVVEIGPGSGLLTTELLRFHPRKLVAYELDDRAVPQLREHFADRQSTLEIREMDFLEADLTQLRNDSGGGRMRIVGNIPYYITSPILFKLIDERASLHSAVLLVQLEVAERLSANPSTKAYGIPTVIANFFAEVTMLFKVKAASFRPPPKVDSAVIRLDFTQPLFTRSPELASQLSSTFDAAAFQRFIRQIFRMRRKTLRNNLKGVIESERAMRLSDEILRRRAEEFSLTELVRLYDSLVRIEPN